MSLISYGRWHIYGLSIVSLLLILSLSLHAQPLGPNPGPGILTHAVTAEQLGQHLLSASDWHPLPSIEDRKQWESLPAEVRNAYLHAAEQLLHCSWPELKATEFLEYVRSGDRKGFQDLSYGRRHQLATLVLAECIENRGRFRDDIVNGIWTICEESYWGVPAHMYLQSKGAGLPDVNEPTVDLFAAETGALLAWTYYLMKDSLDTLSPLVAERIKYEVDRRINAVNLARNDFWWMGLTPKAINNWTPWICSNWLATVLILEENPDKRAHSVYKIMQCLDRFTATYGDDGGCDEGPSYWGRAAGSLFDCIELLHSATGGFVDAFDQPRVKEMARYIMRAHIQGAWFVNFADAPARLSPDAPVVYRFGKAIGDSTMMAFGAKLARDQELGTRVLPGQFGVLGRVLPGLFVLEEMLKAKASDPYLRDSWFPAIQVMTAASEHRGETNGLFLAAQGGHNDENHNHNDVGNFIVYLDGEPVIIDVGVETYTAKTFSKDRYSIWTMQSGFHNLPTINGVQQKEGREFAAKNVKYEADDAHASLSLDIARAYPPEAGVQSWRRAISLKRGSEVVIRDAYELSHVRGETRLSLMTCRKPVIEKEGTIVLPQPPGGGKGKPAEVVYNPDLFSAQAKPIGIQDPQLQSSWGKRIWRIVLTVKHPALKNESVLRIREQR